MLRMCSCVAFEIQYTILLIKHNHLAINHTERGQSYLCGLTGPQGETLTHFIEQKYLNYETLNNLSFYKLLASTIH